MSISTMAANIADKLKRDDYSAQIIEEINRAIEFYSNERFYFNENAESFNTFAGQMNYSSPVISSEIREIDLVRVTVNNSYQYPEQRTFNDIAMMNTTSFQSYPDYWAWYGQNLYLWPIPNSAYEVTLFFQKSYSELSGDESNDFTDNAKDLIEAHVLAVINEVWLKNYDEADRNKQWVITHLQNLRAKTDKLTGGAIVPTVF